eukprot:scaffold22667_cov31-Phaeocystis_antarctica.AAC.2
MAKWMRSIVAGAVDDLVLLNTVTEEAIVSNLQNTFAKNSIYTAIGPVLLSVNPFQPIDGLYTPTHRLIPRARLVLSGSCCQVPSEAAGRAGTSRLRRRRGGLEGAPLPEQGPVHPRLGRVRCRQDRGGEASAQVYHDGGGGAVSRGHIHQVAERSPPQL